MAQFPISDATLYLATVGVLGLCVLLFWVVGYDPRQIPRYLRSNARWIALNALLVIAAAHALMLAPAPVGAPCVESHRVWGPLEMVMTCDSYEFVRNARHPGRLSMYRSWSQSRPLGIMLASLLTVVERPDPENRTPAEMYDTRYDTRPCLSCLQSVVGYPYGQRLQPGWLAYVVLNFFLLLVSLVLFRRLNTPAAGAAAAAVAVLGTFLVFNDAVKGFFWSAHTQMWNVLMPLISILLARAFLRCPARSWRFMAATGMLLGLGLLAYGSLLVSASVVIAAMAVGFWINREGFSFLTLFGKLGLFLGAFATPTVIWISIIKSRTGTYYSPEVQDWRQFIWIYDYWRMGGIRALQYQTRVFLGEFLGHLWVGLWPALLLLTIALVVGVTSMPRLRETIRERALTLGAAVIALIPCLGFFGLMGFYRNRLEFNVVVPVLVIASVLITGLLERMPRRQAIVTILLVVIAAGGYITSALVRVTWPY